MPGCNGFGIFPQDSLFRQIAYLSIIHCNLQVEFRILQLGQTLAKPIRVLQSFHPVRTLVRWNVVAAQRSNRFVSARPHILARLNSASPHPHLNSRRHLLRKASWECYRTKWAIRCQVEQRALFLGLAQVSLGVHS